VLARLLITAASSLRESVFGKENKESLEGDVCDPAKLSRPNTPRLDDHDDALEQIGFDKPASWQPAGPPEPGDAAEWLLATKQPKALISVANRQREKGKGRPLETVRGRYNREIRGKEQE
jgi:hypothetical protein